MFFYEFCFFFLGRRGQNLVYAVRFGPPFSYNCIFEFRVLGDWSNFWLLKAIALDIVFSRMLFGGYEFRYEIQTYICYLHEATEYPVQIRLLMTIPGTTHGHVDADSL